MSYIDALYRKDEDKVYVVERNSKGKRVFFDYDARYIFYYISTSEHNKDDPPHKSTYSSMEYTHIKLYK